MKILISNKLYKRFMDKTFLFYFGLVWLFLFFFVWLFVCFFLFLILLCFILFSFFETGFPLWTTLAVLELSLYSRLTSNLQRSVCFCFQNAGIKALYARLWGKKHVIFKNLTELVKCFEFVVLGSLYIELRKMF